jgi:hypothetical protein
MKHALLTSILALVLAGCPEENTADTADATPPAPVATPAATSAPPASATASAPPASPPHDVGSAADAGAKKK